MSDSDWGKGKILEEKGLRENFQATHAVFLYLELLKEYYVSV